MNSFSDETYYETHEDLQMDLKYVDLQRLQREKTTKIKENINKTDKNKSNYKIIITAILIILCSLICIVCDYLLIKIAILILAIYLLFCYKPNWKRC